MQDPNINSLPLVVAPVFLFCGLMLSILTLAVSESFSTFLSFSSGWQLALGNILLSLLVSVSLPIYFFLTWIRLRKINVDYSKADGYLSTLKDGETVLFSRFIDQAKQGGYLVSLQTRLAVALIGWVVALVAVNYLNVTIAMRLLKDYSWGPKPVTTQQVQLKPKIEERIVSHSPSGKYWIKIGYRSGMFDPLELAISGEKKPIVLSTEAGFVFLPSKNRIDFSKKNVIWKKDESAFAFTYFTDVEVTPRTPGYLAIFTTSGNLIKMVDLGNASYYGNNIERPFYPIVSPDGKYIAVATDLIHQISVFDFVGNKIKDLPTKYSKVELFSPEMYELEGGKYSPFLEYKWSEDGKTILYRFEGTEKYFEVKFQ